MHIELSTEHYQQLAGQATAAGYPDVTAFVVALAESPVDPRGELSRDALTESVARLNESFADEAAGRVRDWDDAKRDLAQRYGTPAAR